MGAVMALDGETASHSFLASWSFGEGERGRSRVNAMGGWENPDLEA